MRTRHEMRPGQFPLTWRTRLRCQNGSWQKRNEPGCGLAHFAVKTVRMCMCVNMHVSMCVYMVRMCMGKA